jgi:hypothetical protein
VDTPMTDRPPKARLPRITRHVDDEWIDAVRIRTAPRYKQSDLSGSEWRTSAVVEWVRNGTVVHSKSYHSIKAALAYIARHAAGTHPGDFEAPEYEKLDPALYRSLDEDYCAQPGCGEKWTSEFRIKVRYENCNPTTYQPNDDRIRYCQKHVVRGDSDCNDCDSNLELTVGPGGGAVDWTGATISVPPVMVVEAATIEDVPDAVRKGVEELRQQRRDH